MFFLSCFPTISNSKKYKYFWPKYLQCSVCISWCSWCF
jgi:hypothetical protein